MYEVIKHFTDLQDKCHPYNVGDTFPREGQKADGKRIAELSGKENKQGVPLIKKVAPKKTPKAEDKTSAE